MTLAAERRAARERALGLLYEAEVKGVSGAEALADLPVPPDPFARELVAAVDEHRARLDELIERFARGWSLRRMPALDRAAVRMGTAELIVRPDVPTGVVLAETVDLAARFSTDGSGRFVNGLLARIAREVRGEAGTDLGDPAPLEDTAPGAGAGAPAGPERARAADALIIDLDGVIRHWEPIEDIEADLGLPAGAMATVAFEPDRLLRAMDGRLTFEAWCEEIGGALAAEHGIEAGDAAAAWASTRWRIDLDVIELVRAVRAAGIPVALLSNASTRLLTDLERSGIDGEFDHVFSSAELGEVKPDPGIFATVAGRLGLPPERCLFIDDLDANVEGARAAGMPAEVFSGLDDLRRTLEVAGLV